MHKRHDLLLLIGVAVIVLGGALFLNLLPDEPLWTEWLLGPLVAFAGLVLVIVGIALRCYSGDFANDRGAGHATPAMKHVH